MNLGLDGIKAKPGGGSGKYPSVGGCKVAVLGSEVEQGKFGKQWRVDLKAVDFEDSNYKKWFSLEGQYAESGKASMKALFIKLSELNEGILTDKEVESGSFDEKKLVNMEIGTVLKYNKKGYLNPTWFDTVEKVMAYVPTEAELIRPNAPAQSAPASNGSKPSPF